MKVMRVLFDQMIFFRKKSQNDRRSFPQGLRKLASVPQDVTITKVVTFETGKTVFLNRKD